MTIGSFVTLVKSSWRVLVGSFVLCLLLGLMYWIVTPKSYTAKSRTYVMAPAGSSVSEMSDGATYVKEQAPSFVELGRSDLILARVRKALNLSESVQELQRDLALDTPMDTSILEVSVVSGDPERAAAIANGVAQELIKALPTLGGSLEGTPRSPRGVLIDPASPPAASAPSVITVGLGVLILTIVLFLPLLSVARALSTKEGLEATRVEARAAAGENESASK